MSINVNFNGALASINKKLLIFSNNLDMKLKREVTRNENDTIINFQ